MLLLVVLNALSLGPYRVALVHHRLVEPSSNFGSHQTVTVERNRQVSEFVVLELAHLDHVDRTFVDRRIRVQEAGVPVEIGRSRHHLRLGVIHVAADRTQGHANRTREHRQLAIERGRRSVDGGEEPRQAGNEDEQLIVSIQEESFI